MSRLIDRILSGCKPVSLGDMFPSRDEMDRVLLRSITKESSEQLNDKELHRLLPLLRREYFSKESLKKPDTSVLEGIPVFAGDEVAIYTLSLPEATTYWDVVSSMAPPFGKFFIEFQGFSKTPPNLGSHALHAWGCLFNVVDDPEKILYPEGFEGGGKPRWVLNVTTFLERDKGKPFGPVMSHSIGLAEDGTWFRRSDGEVWWVGALADIGVPWPEGIKKQYHQLVQMLMLPALLTISFLHCRNVKVQEIVPPEKLSKKHRKNKSMTWSDTTFWTSSR